MATRSDLQEQVDAQVSQWYAAADLLTDEGVLDKGKLRTRIAEHVATNCVAASLADRKAKAITKGALTCLVVPSVQPTGEARESASEVENAAYVKIEAAVWREASPEYNSAVQRMVGELAEGMILVKFGVAIDANEVPACYVTGDQKCLDRDFIAPLDKKLDNLAKRFARNMGLVGVRQPALAAHAESVVKSATKTATTHARETFQLALGVSTEAGE
jgi:hypothetical protein